MGATVADLDLLHPQECLFVATVRAAYAAWRWHYNHGYICYSLGGSEKRFEHRLVAELAHGVIPARYHVHHVDKNTLHNHADNLAILSPGEHSRLHHLEGARVTLQCAICGQPFRRRLWEVENRSPKYCSATCKTTAERKVRHLTPEKLNQLMHEVRNWCELGRMFGVSDNAMRKWAKRYGLDLSICDGRRTHIKN